MTTTDPLFGMLLAFGGAQGQVSPLVQLIPFALVLAIFYFVILLPMKNRQKKVEAFLAALKVGDKVVTSGGLFGSIAKIGDDAIQLQIAPNVRVDISRAADRRLPGTGAGCRRAELHKSWRRTFVGKSSSFSVSSRLRSGRSIRPIRRSGSAST